MSKFLDEQGLSHLWSKIKFLISLALGTVYSAGTGISIDGNNVISLASLTGAAGTYGPSANVTGTNNTTVLIPLITVDSYGRVTGVTNRTYTSKDTTYNSGTGINIDSNNNINLKFNTSGTSYTGTVLKLWPLVVSGEGDDSILVRVPVATSSLLGVIKVGNYLTATSDGTLSVNTDSLAATLYGEGDGIVFDQDYNISVNPASNGGITVTSAGVALNVGTGTLGTNKFNVLLEGGIPKVGINNATTSAPGLMTAAQVTALNGKANSSDVYTKTETYTKTEVDTAIANANHLSVETANSLDAVTSPEENTIYIVPCATSPNLSRALNSTIEYSNGSSDTEDTPSLDIFLVSTLAITLPAGLSITDAELTVGGAGADLAYPIYVLNSVTAETQVTKYGTLPYTNTGANSMTVYLGVDIDCTFPGGTELEPSEIDDLTVTYNIGYGTSTNIDAKAEFIRINNNTAWEKLGTTDRLTIDKITNSEIDTICI